MDQVRCGNPECQNKLNEAEDVPLDERVPCPRCGSPTRLYSRTLAGQVTATGALDLAVIAIGAAAVYAGARILARPPGPEPGYHGPHDHADLIGGALVFGIAVAAAVVTTRDLVQMWRDRFVL